MKYVHKKEKTMRKVSREMEKISKKVGTAIFDYQMIQDGDKIMVGVSGGKDSLTLLNMLKYRQTFAPVKFDVLAVHIDMGMPGMNVEKLKQYFENEKIEYRIDQIDILEEKGWDDIGCFWCSWNRRKAFFELGEKIGYNKIAYGHHFDDIVETIMMNLLYQGNISAMLPNQELFEGKMRIIRPLAYIDEKDIVDIARKKDYPQFVEEKCPHDNTSKRAVIKRVLAELSEDNAYVKMNIFKGVKRIKKEYIL